MAKTVKVRIACAVDPKGDWSACGWKGADDDVLVSSCIDSLDHGEQGYWIEVELQVPTPQQPSVQIESVTEQIEESPHKFMQKKTTDPFWQF